MNIRFVAQEADWTPAQKECVLQKLVKPLVRFLNTENFDLSVHLGFERVGKSNSRPRLQMWAVLQTFDGRGNQVVRRNGNDFVALINEVSSGMRLQVSKAHARRRFSLNLFRFQIFNFQSYSPATKLKI